MSNIIHVDFSSKASAPVDEITDFLQQRFKRVLTDARLQDEVAADVARYVGEETAKRLSDLDQSLKFSFSGEIAAQPDSDPQKLADAVSDLWEKEMRQYVTRLEQAVKQHIVLAAFDALKILANSDGLSR